MQATRAMGSDNWNQGHVAGCLRGGGGKGMHMILWGGMGVLATGVLVGMTHVQGLGFVGLGARTSALVGGAWRA